MSLLFSVVFLHYVHQVVALAKTGKRTLYVSSTVWFILFLQTNELLTTKKYLGYADISIFFIQKYLRCLDMYVKLKES